MADNSKRLSAHGTAWIAIAMSWCAGCVDAAAYDELRRLYTSHMTGNTASFASHMLNTPWQEESRYGWVIACFIIGLLASASLTHAERRKGIRSAFAAALSLEVALLIVFVCLGWDPAAPGWLLVFLPAAAMGVQTVTVTRVGSLRVYTTYLTGTLSKFSEAATEYLFWFRDRTKGRFGRRLRRVLLVTPRQEPAQQAALTGGLWAAFFGGAISGFAGAGAWGRVVLIMPAAVLAAIIVIDIRFPVALGEVSDDEIRRQRHPRAAKRAGAPRFSPGNTG